MRRIGMNAAARWMLVPYRYIKRSLFRKILVSFLAIVTLTVISLETNYYVETSADIKQKAISNMEQISDQSAKIIGSYMSAIQREAWNYFGDTEFQDFVQHMDSDPAKYSYYLSKLRKLTSENPIFNIIMVNPLNGFPMTVGNNYGNQKQLDLFEKEGLRLNQIALQNDGKGAWVISQRYDPKTGKLVNVFVFVQALKRITVTSQQIIGTLMIELSLDELQNSLQSTDNKDQSDFYLVSALDGKIVFARDENVLGTSVLDEKSFNELKASGDKQMFINVQGDPSLVVYKELADTDWLVIGKAPVRQVLKQVNAVAQRTVLIGLAYILGSMLLAGMLSSRVIKPLKRLRKGMKQLETGNFNIAVPVDTEDEIGYFCISFNQMADEINRLIVKVYETELVKKDAEIKALQSQINPHFLYNTLGTIDSLASADADRRISIISRSLAKMFRYNISGGNMSTLEAEIGQIGLYLSIQKIRYESRLEYSLTIEPGLESMRLPKLLLQPLVENSIIHGIEHMAAKGYIRIQVVSVDEQDAEIRVWNNGQAIPEGRLKEIEDMLETWSPASHADPQSSIGLVNVQARLKLIYGNRYGLTIHSSPEQGTEFILRVSRLGEDGGRQHETSYLG
jgi:two-component system sensor histidine kinase YesM